MLRRLLLFTAVFSLPLIFAGTTLEAQLRYTETDIPVRDGKSLKADLYIGDGTQARPVILVQTPYSKLPYRFTLGRKGSNFPLDTNAYHYVFVDWRGFYASKDAAVAGYDRGLDGYDIVEWIAAQPWCNGKVATLGGSALGMIQFQTARHHPPHLVCAAPFIIDYRSDYSDYYFHGVLRHEHVQTLERLGFLTMDVITSRPVENFIWDLASDQSDYPEDIAVPLLMGSGWFDHYPAAVLRAFTDLRARSAEPVRGMHKLIMGPWSHGEVDFEEQGDLRFPDAVNTLRDAALQFFAYHLLGAKNGWPLLPAVRYYQMGENVWKQLDGWDARPRTAYTLHLHADGSLASAAPTAAGNLPFSYDPRNPSPSHGGARFNPLDATAIPGPLDISDAVESRSDALLFSTEILTVPVATAGPVEVTVTLSSDKLDTDIAVRLCDVYPDGRSIILGDGIRRMRFRDGTRSESLLVPGTPYTTTITLPDLAHTFLPGHRIRLVLTSSNWPRFDRNLNNGGEMYTEGDTATVNNVLHVGGGHAASITFEVSSPVSANGAPFPEQQCGIVSLYPQPYTASHGRLNIGVVSASPNAALIITDALGRTVAELPVAGLGSRQQLSWSGIDMRGRELPSGVYVMRLRDGENLVQRKFVLAR